MVYVMVPGFEKGIPVCESCMKDDHLSYGADHRSGDVDYRGCKNVSDDGQTQCNCSQDFEELWSLLFIDNEW